MTKEFELGMINERRNRRKKKALLKKKLRLFILKCFCFLAVEALFLSLIIYGIDSMTVYK